MRLLLVLFAAVLGFYIYFVGYAAWFFFLQGEAGWAQAAVFFFTALLAPLIPAAVWLRFRTGGVRLGMPSVSKPMDMETAAGAGNAAKDGSGGGKRKS